MEKDNRIKGKGFIILGAVMAVISVLLFCGSVTGDFLPGKSYMLLFITTPFVINGFAYLIDHIVTVFKGRTSDYYIPVFCLVLAVISAIIGLISYVNNHKLILGEIEAMIIWLFVSVPSLVVAIIHFIVSYIHKSRK